MSEAKLVVIYPRPKDIESFEKVYLTEHVPMSVEKLDGKTKIVATKITGSPQGVPAFYRIVEVYFPSKSALEACAATMGAQETLAHAAKISTGGTPLILIAEGRRSRSARLLALKSANPTRSLRLPSDFR